MYIPNAYREDDFDTLVAFMRAYSFATLVSIQDGLPVASHIPLVVSARDGEVLLSGHVAKANPQWQVFETGVESLAIFTGPHAYISPSLYETRSSVPTWNYIAVHAYGIPRIVSYAEAQGTLRVMLDEMIETYDPTYRRQWEELSDKFREGMMQGVTAFQMPVTRLEGKAKLSQNRSERDRHNVAQALLAHSDPTIRDIGVAMEK